MSPFLPPGGKALGKITVGVRCLAPSTWTIYMPAQVQINGDYYIAAAPLARGQVLAASDLTKVSGDLSTLPAGAITDPGQAIGRTMTATLASGSVLRADNMRSQTIVQQGQVVRIVSKGTGFTVSTDGQALNNAGEGQVVKAKTNSGQVLSGIARAGGTVEVVY
jgi:flagella basal body P-ring formation protein FlgA